MTTTVMELLSHNASSPDPLHQEVIYKRPLAYYKVKQELGDTERLMMWMRWRDAHFLRSLMADGKFNKGNARPGAWGSSPQSKVIPYFHSSGIRWLWHHRVAHGTTDNRRFRWWKRNNFLRILPLIYPDTFHIYPFCISWGNTLCESPLPTWLLLPGWRQS